MAIDHTHHRASQHRKLTGALQALAIALPSYALFMALTGWGTHITGSATIAAAIALWLLIPYTPPAVVRALLWGTLVVSSVLLAATGTPLLAVNVTGVALCIAGIIAFRNQHSLGGALPDRDMISA